jgi:hypothetical protein
MEGRTPARPLQVAKLFDIDHEWLIFNSRPPCCRRRLPGVPAYQDFTSADKGAAPGDFEKAADSIVDLRPACVAGPGDLRRKRSGSGRGNGDDRGSTACERLAGRRGQVGAPRTCAHLHPLAPARP